MHAVARKSDFIAFPEMRAATDPTQDAASIHYRDVVGAALDFTAYLKKTFGKPILFSYLALSSYAHSDPLGLERCSGGNPKGSIRPREELIKKRRVRPGLFLLL